MLFRGRRAPCQLCKRVRRLVRRVVPWKKKTKSPTR